MTASTSQWIFPLEALNSTPTRAPLQRELYDRARGIEFLYRLGSSLLLPRSAIFTAATWFHRFYMRYAMEDYHRQVVAASCIFLATKTEEAGRKLRDVARVCQAKITGQEANDIHDDDVKHCQDNILLTEEVLIEALCFDFVVESPHAELVRFFDTQVNSRDSVLEESAWSIAHDSYRTPLCILYSTKIIAVACYILAQKIMDGLNSLSLDARISAAPSGSLPTPPSNKPSSPDVSRAIFAFFGIKDVDYGSIAEVLNILIEFYNAQDKSLIPYIGFISGIQPPKISTTRSTLYALEDPQAPQSAK